MDFKTKASRAVAGFLLVGGLTAGAAGIAGAQDGNGGVFIEGTSQTNTTDQTNDQVQVQAPDQQQEVDQVNLQVSEQGNSIVGASQAEAHAGDGENSAVGDTSSSSSIGDSNLANSNPQTGNNQNGQSQEVVGGNQANAPVSVNGQDTSYAIDDVGGDVDNSFNLDLENIGNDSFNTDESTDVIIGEGEITEDGVFGGDGDGDGDGGGDGGGETPVDPIDALIDGLLGDVLDGLFD